MAKILKIFSFFFFLFFVSACQKTEETKLADFFNKSDVKILVTDSGLGGVSVAADVVERLKKGGVFQKAQVIFFNAQPHLLSGYNSMKTTEQKVQVFNNALKAIEEKINPDLILIACNTLSVIYEKTEYSKRAEIPVIGIVRTGVDLINKKMENNAGSKVIIFATETTVEQNKHKSALMDFGISADKIITMACPSLAGRIESDSESDTTKSLVNKYVKASIPSLSQGDKVFVSYNCTHYGYVDNLFRNAFKEENIEVLEFLDPNPFMADFMFTDTYLNRYPKTDVSVEIISQPELPPGRQASIYNLIEPKSPQTAEALFEYKWEVDFFEWESIVKAETEYDNK